MAGRPQRGVFQTIFKHFINSLKPRRFTGDLMGTDHLGNKYYETPRQADSYKKTGSRYFEPRTKDDFEQEIPAEWEAWLRYRRKDPPAESEVLRNVAIMNAKKRNAAELDSAVKAARPSDRETDQLYRSKGFPVYPEYQDAESDQPRNRKD